MKKRIRCLSLLWTVLFLLSTLGVTAQAAPTLVSPSPNSFGEIEKITIKDMTDVYSAGAIVVGGVEMIIPKNLLIDLPANRLSLQQIFNQAPAACKALGESGLAKGDRCNGTGSGGIATLSAVRTNAGNVIIGDLFIQKAAESVHGVVTYINYAQGYYRVNGLPNDPLTGAMVRLNDPGSRHTIQSGAGCAGGPNCSPDPRFTLDPDNYTNTFATGYPLCIPSTVSRPFPGLAGVPAGTAVAAADGTGDLLCPDTNRTAALVEPAVADSRRFAPVQIGDSVLAEGNYEAIGGVRFLSAHSSSVQKALSTRNVADQPDYLFLEEVGVEAPPYQNQRLVTLLIGFTTLANPSTDVDLWSLHRDAVNNAVHEYPFASVRGCDVAGGAGTCSNQGLVGAGANIFKIRHDVDFLVGPTPKGSPCAHLLASRFATSHPGICSGPASTAKDIAVLSPVPHEIIARTGKKIDSPAGSLITIDINGNPATNGEYLFPLGLNLGGLGVAEMSEVNINELFTPIPFEGITWNLDRRLGPAGCLNAGGCEAGPVGSAAFALDPFPFSGLDPRLQASLLPNVSYIDPVFSPTTLTSSRNRMFSYVLPNGNFNGNSTVIPYVLGTLPPDPPLIPIGPTQPTSSLPPITVADAVSTNGGIPVAISVLANDVAVLGIIDPASVTVVSNPVSGTVLVNSPAGTITYTPAAGVTLGTASFTYTVANNFGSVSLPATVTVSISPNNQLPFAANDSATTRTDTPVSINVILNDTDSDGFINTASIAIVTNPLQGTAVAQPNGTVIYTPNNAFTGPDSFSYTVSDNQGAISNIATASVTVFTPGNITPVAVADTSSATSGQPRVISVLANDSDIDGALNAASIVITTPATNGTAVANANGTVTYTSAAGFTGTATFAYTVADNLGLVSAPAVVTVSVVPANETITVTRARYDTGKSLWIITGTTTVFGVGVTNSMTVYRGSTIAGTPLGTAPVTPTGTWTLNVTSAPSSATISVQSTGGATRLAAPVQVR